jgi:hypothetical protein
MTLFVKSILGGVMGVVLMWIIIVFSWYVWRVRRVDPTPAGLGAVAGGWDMLLHTPFVLLLLTLAFGIGLWVVARRNL